MVINLILFVDLMMGIDLISVIDLMSKKNRDFGEFFLIEESEIIILAILFYYFQFFSKCFLGIYITLFHMDRMSKGLKHGSWLPVKFVCISVVSLSVMDSIFVQKCV